MSFLRFLRPFKIIPQIKSLFGIYFGVGILLGQIGILISLLICARHTTIRFVDLLNVNLSAGNFYTFSIALIASAAVPFLVEYLSSDDIRFKHYKIISSLILLGLMVPMIFFYSVLVSDSTAQLSQTQNGVCDRLQLLFYLATIVLCTYTFCVSYLHLDYESYAELDNADLVRLRRSVSAGNEHDSRNIGI